ncbi:MAG: hypothetical protein ACK5JT_13855, partial [Hyphomicrobiaceae bacterium]
EAAQPARCHAVRCSFKMPMTCSSVNYNRFIGELRTILEWTARQAIGKAGKKTNPAASATGLSVLLVAWAHTKLSSLLIARDLFGTGIKPPTP